MALNYKKLGEFLRLTDERNSDLSITNLQGVSISKQFIPSIANIIGTDLSSYKIVRKGQFAYGPVTSRNGDKVSIALLESDDCIISSSYLSFEVVDKTKLDPEYLMLWFMRPEFDRYARFMSNGSAREIFDWKCMCGVELPVPSIEEQRIIVHDYKVIADRIELLKKINVNLEKQAQVLYKSWFVDFDPFGNNLPSNWSEVCISDIASDVVCGKTPSTDDESNFGGKYPFITIPDMHDSVYATKTERTLSDKGISKLLPENSVCVSCIATVGLVSLVATPSQTNQQINSIICKKDVSSFYVYLKMRTLRSELEALGAGGSATLNVSKSLFSQIKMLYPDVETCNKFDNIVKPIFDSIRNNQLEIERLIDFKEALNNSMIKEVA